MPGKVAKTARSATGSACSTIGARILASTRRDIEAFQFDTLYGAIDTDEIEFGSYKGRRKWENLRQIPTQQMRDALMNMIVYQGDTEFASVEQQAQLARERAYGLGPPRHHASDDRGNAPRLADVRAAGGSLRLFGQG